MQARQAQRGTARHGKLLCSNHYYADTAYPRYSNIGVTAKWPRTFSLLVEGDFAPAHYGTRRAPERVLLHHYCFSTVQPRSLSTNPTSLYREYSVATLLLSRDAIAGLERLYLLYVPFGRVGLPPLLLPLGRSNRSLLSVRRARPRLSIASEVIALL